MARIDLYTTAHKGLRALLFETAQTVARCGTSRHEEIRTCAAIVRRTIGVLHSHARRCDDHLLPHLARLSPVLAAEIETRFDRCAGFEQEVERTLDRLETSTSVEQASLLRRLHRAMSPLVVEHVRRMELEEQHANRILWAHLEDAELAVLEREMFAASSGTEVVEWLSVLFAAASLDEMAAMLARLQTHVSEDMVSALCSAKGVPYDASRRSAITASTGSDVGERVA
jgi:hypothetical protein